MTTTQKNILIVEPNCAEASMKAAFAHVKGLRCLPSLQELSATLFMDGLRAEPMPNLILIDAFEGVERVMTTVRRIKSDPRLRRIPLVILAADVEAAACLSLYEAGVSSVIPRPLNGRLSEVFSTLDSYWFQISELPKN